MSFTLYRHFASSGTLLYAGKTNDPPRRLYEHQMSKEWWVYVVRTEYEHFRTAKELEAAEKRAIRTEHPVWNKTHNKTRQLADITRILAGDGDQVLPFFDHLLVCQLPEYAEFSAILQDFAETIGHAYETAEHEISPEDFTRLLTEMDKARYYRDITGHEKLRAPATTDCWRYCSAPVAVTAEGSGKAVLYRCAHGSWTAKVQ